MQTHITKVAIIGAGAVGATVAFSLVVKGVAAQIALIDINEKKAMGEALDMRHSMDFQRRNVGIVYGGYEECSDADRCNHSGGSVCRREGPPADAGQNGGNHA